MRNLLYILVLLISFSSFGQNNKDALRLCSVLQSNSFSSNSAAEDALQRILGTIGASKRFVLQPCSNINNAVATSYKGIRYILYDPDFMNTLNYGNNWGNLFILAHEVGHHINGHSLDLVLYAADAVESVSLAQSRQQELEADEFAGFVLAKLGGPISAANQVISKISNNSDDSYNTHPSRSKRLKAVLMGYNKSNTKLYTNSSPKDKYLYDAFDYYKRGDFLNSISLAELSIKIDGESSVKYSFLGLCYWKLASEIKPSGNWYTKNEIEKLDSYYSSSYNFYTNALNIEESKENYYRRALVLIGLEGVNSINACKDAQKAYSLGHRKASKFLENFKCN